MSLILDTSHYYIVIEEIKYDKVWKFILFDVSNLSKIIEPINMNKEHECIKQIELDIENPNYIEGQLNYQCMNTMIEEHKIRVTDHTIVVGDRVKICYDNLKYMVFNVRIDHEYLYIASYFLGMVDAIGEDTFRIDTSKLGLGDINDFKLMQLEAKFCMLGISSHDIQIYRKHIRVCIENIKDYNIAIKKMILKSETTRLVISLSLLGIIDLKNDRITEIKVIEGGKFSILTDDLILPHSKIFSINIFSCGIECNNIVLNGNTLIEGSSCSFTFRKGTCIKNSHLIKGLRYVHLNFNNDSVLDLRGLETHKDLVGIQIYNLDVLILNSETLSVTPRGNISRADFPYLNVNIIYSANIYFDPRFRKNEYRTGKIVFMRNNLEEDLKTFAKYRLEDRFHRVATQEERDKYQNIKY